MKKQIIINVRNLFFLVLHLIINEIERFIHGKKSEGVSKTNLPPRLYYRGVGGDF